MEVSGWAISHNRYDHSESTPRSKNGHYALTYRRGRNPKETSELESGYENTRENSEQETL